MSSNSPLVVHTNISPHKTSPRNAKIDTITIHCVVGQATAESLGNWFKQAATKASSNYGVDKDGRVGMYVEEKDRSWCTSSGANDNRAITIEVASDREHPYKVNDKAYSGLLDLLTDICKRNGIKQLIWKADKNLIGQPDKQNMTVHRWFANKACPGEYLYNLHPAIATEVNRRLGSAAAPETEEQIVPGVPAQPQADGFYRVRTSWADSKSQKGAYKILANAVKCADNNPGYSVFDDKGAAVYTGSNTAPSSAQLMFSAYMVKVTVDSLDIRKGPGTDSAVVGAIKDNGTYTIVEEANGPGATKWGRLKSGAGWISLDQVQKR